MVKVKVSWNPGDSGEPGDRDPGHDTKAQLEYSVYDILPDTQLLHVEQGETLSYSETTSQNQGVEQLTSKDYQATVLKKAWEAQWDYNCNIDVVNLIPQPPAPNEHTPPASDTQLGVGNEVTYV
jgi:hypothetical protein